ncbi:hypothetical protein F4009_19675 [Candidatus Poribacteria bacterium]|nr:hypothetical protein [Candidatus Poribacteria bacterium]MYK96186.1 hypothetical protein [Candidatus Poribacteria bacterium]
MKIANNWGNIITKLGIGCVVCLLLGAAILLYAQDEKKSEFIGTKSQMDAAKMKEIAAVNRQAMAEAPEQPQRQRNRAWGRQNRGGGVDFGENAVFYKTIIDHNLFRPLGWTPPNNEPSYSLVGAKVVDPNNGISQATLLENRSNRYHFVTIGTKVGDMTVKDIQTEEVTLDKAGETITLKQNWPLQLLTVNRERGGNRGGESGSERAGNDNAGRNRANQTAERREQSEQRERANAEQNRRREMMERMRNASPEERRRMIERFRGGGDRGGRRGRGRDR